MRTLFDIFDYPFHARNGKRGLLNGKEKGHTIRVGMPMRIYDQRSATIAHAGAPGLRTRLWLTSMHLCGKTPLLHQGTSGPSLALRTTEALDTTGRFASAGAHRVWPRVSSGSRKRSM